MNKKFLAIMAIFYYALTLNCGLWMMICLHYGFMKEAAEFVGLSFVSLIFAEMFKNIRKKIP